MFLWLANWWDTAELWLTGMPFPVQFALVIVVLGPLCFGLAWAIDRAVDFVSNRVTRQRDLPPPLDDAPVTAKTPADTETSADAHADEDEPAESLSR